MLSHRTSVASNQPWILVATDCMSKFAANHVLSFFCIQISSWAKLKHEVRAHVTNVNGKYPVFLECRENFAHAYTFDTRRSIWRRGTRLVVHMLNKW